MGLMRKEYNLGKVSKWMSQGKIPSPLSSSDGEQADITTSKQSIAILLPPVWLTSTIIGIVLSLVKWAKIPVIVNGFEPSNWTPKHNSNRLIDGDHRSTPDGTFLLSDHSNNNYRDWVAWVDLQINIITVNGNIITFCLLNIPYLLLICYYYV